MSILFPPTPVVRPGRASLLDHASRHYFDRVQRWFDLGDHEHLQAWRKQRRLCEQAGWRFRPQPSAMVGRAWAEPIAAGAETYARLTLEAVDDAVAKKHVWPNEPATGAAVPRLSYVGQSGIFVVAPSCGDTRPFCTSFRPRSPDALGVVDDAASFTQNARGRANQRMPGGSALVRWERRAVRRAARLASSARSPRGSSAGRGGNS